MGVLVTVSTVSNQIKSDQIKSLHGFPLNTKLVQVIEQVNIIRYNEDLGLTGI